MRPELRAPRFSIRGPHDGPEPAAIETHRFEREVPDTTALIEINVVFRLVRRVHSTAWLLLLVGSIAAWISLGRLHYIHNADSVVTVLVSLQHWTAFYWGQDRFGMLVPLIATPIGHPLANMLVQGWLTTVAALLAPFLAARYLGAGRYWFATGTLANAFFLVTFSDEFQFEWLVKQPYALSMSLAAASLLVAQRRGFAAAVASMTLMLLAHWVNLTVLVIVVPLILVRRSFDGPSLCAMGIGPAGGLLIRYLSNAPPFTRTEILPIAQWPHACFMLLRTTLGEVAHPRLFEVAVAVSAIAATALWIKPRHSEPLKAASSAVFVGCIYMSVSGTSLHVQLNHFMPRYVLPSVSLFGVAIALVLVASAGDRPKLVALAAVVALVTASVVSYGIPSVKRLRRTIDSRFGMMTQQALAAGATVIVGDYWTVWPAVFHANLALYERRSTRRVFGLTYRSEVTDALWLSGGEAKQILVVGYQSDSSIDGYLARIRLPVAFMGSSGKLAIYRISAD